MYRATSLTIPCTAIGVSTYKQRKYQWGVIYYKKKTGFPTHPAGLHIHGLVLIFLITVIVELPRGVLGTPHLYSVETHVIICLPNLENPS